MKDEGEHDPRKFWVDITGSWLGVTALLLHVAPWLLGKRDEWGFLRYVAFVLMLIALLILTVGNRLLASGRSKIDPD